MSDHYARVVAEFDLSEVEARLNGSLAQGFNAYDECIERHITAGRADDVALVHQSPDKVVSQLSYADLAQRSAQVANYLQQQGVKAGDRVAAMLPRTPELLSIIFGAWRLGAVFQPLFTAFGYEAVDFRLQQAQTQVVFVDQSQREKFAAVTANTKRVLMGTAEQAAHWGDDHFTTEMAAQPVTFASVLLPAEAPFLQMFTSGTVGKSKGVAVPLKALLAFYTYMHFAVGLRPNDRFWNMADPGWAYGLYYGVTGPFLIGARTYINEAGFSAEDTLDFLKQHQITNLASAPTAYRMMKSSGVLDGQAEHLAIRVASSAGEPLNTEVVNWVTDHLGCRVMDHYGQTETGMTCCCHHQLDHDCPVGSMGLPLPGYRLVILDAENRELGPGETGQLAVDIEHSPAFFFQGYTWQEKVPFYEGYYLTGDMVEQHQDGTFWFAGRDDDIISTAGYRVGPTDVENTVLEHAAVAESAAVGKPDPERGFVIKAYVVLREGYEKSDALVKEIQTLVRERLSTHAFPREVEFVDALPKTPSGKIQRFVLRRQAAEESNA
ncbi:AMP-binding protein [Terasakiispira papahanaumokuakeensis]|uniref:AMP-binding protein n=1 Tax=Terasakiispira papahanaumokuakeensis TaxID=197479 RepID=A0A1E2VAQ9_9GAMM|nr:AMP-binding protein [Terasakiispira papahanaumokuakeensis]ODC04098.1 AMP-binding protein [Terasakiispira papahanaumokuakeensis]